MSNLLDAGICCTSDAIGSESLCGLSQRLGFVTSAECRLLWRAMPSIPTTFSVRAPVSSDAMSAMRLRAAGDLADAGQPRPRLDVLRGDPPPCRVAGGAGEGGRWAVRNQPKPSSSFRIRCLWIQQVSLRAKKSSCCKHCCPHARLDFRIRSLEKPRLASPRLKVIAS